MPEWTDIDASAARELIAANEGRPFLVPRERQNQTVEYAYTGVGTRGVLCRRTDRSDMAVSYSLRDWRDSDEEYPGLNFEP